LIRWRSFACVEEDRSLLRRSFHLISKIAGSPCALYTHECMPYAPAADGIDAIAARLKQKIGPGATSMAELCEADDFGPHAWYIDTFHDFTG